jgi:iron(II)-dependent oxidoreductase
MSMAIASATIHEISQARALTDHLLAQVVPDALYDRPIPQRHRLVFYIGHLDAFEWNLVGKGCLGLEPVEQELDSLFAFGIDPKPGALPSDSKNDWPDLTTISRYVARVRGSMDRVVRNAPDHAVRMILEHRLMHAETLVYLIHNLPYSRRLTQMRDRTAGAPSPPLQFVEVPAGTATLGIARGAAFGWDNEFDVHQRDVGEFAISKYKVTNDQYLAFVKEGGEPPHYWIERNGEWRYRGFHEEVPLPGNCPVYVNYIQASAFAQWAGKALPTEAQFHRAAFGSTGLERPYPWGTESPRGEHGNFDFSHSDVVPVDANPAGDSAFGVSQLMGNGWEWTSTPFAPFQGFTPNPLYSGYSADFFDGDHYVLKGASCVTDHTMLRRSFRNWFRGTYRYAYTSFRLVEN